MNMKVVFAALLSMFAVAGAMAQDCTFFFPQSEGTVLVRKGYDAKGNLQTIMTYKVDEVETIPSGQQVEADYVFTNAAGTVINKGDIEAYCQNGEFFMDMKQSLSYPGVVSEMNTDVDITDNFVNYPNTFTPDFNSDNVYMDDASVKIYDKKNRKNRRDISIYDREYMTNETITTPAGTFECAKVKYKMDTRSPKSKEKITGYGYEWYAPNVGLVRTEQYNDNNALQSYTVLEEIK
ncbi:hypothetical protein [Parabacteroides bouchesdurhonensis]|uniref:TapB family protein n=1 Tax=Parabacteroides bouchesdurhonensis TaxID=1936995 RepID=UPI000C856B36